MSKSVRAGAALAVMCASLVGLTAPQASADDHHSNKELIQMCGDADYCHFHPTAPPQTLPGKQRRVGATQYNCGNLTSSKDVSWTHTESETNSYSLSLGVEAGYADIFSVSMQQTFGFSWESSHSFQETTSVKIPPGHKGWVALTVPRRKVKGTYELHFGSEVDGHYIHYVPFTANGPKKGSHVDITTDDAKMTAADRKAHC